MTVFCGNLSSFFFPFNSTISLYSLRCRNYALGALGLFWLASSPLITLSQCMYILAGKIYRESLSSTVALPARTAGIVACADRIGDMV